MHLKSDKLGNTTAPPIIREQQNWQALMLHMMYYHIVLRKKFDNKTHKFAQVH